MPARLERLPGHLEQQPLLRVHARRLARRDAEELGVEPIDVVEEAAASACDIFPGALPDRDRSRRRRPSDRRGTSPIASTPSRSSSQNASGSSAPPGKRQPIPTMAIGSRPRALDGVELRLHLLQGQEGLLQRRERGRAIGGATHFLERLPSFLSRRASASSSESCSTCAAVTVGAGGAAAAAPGATEAGAGEGPLARTSVSR